MTEPPVQYSTQELLNEIAGLIRTVEENIIELRTKQAAEESKLELLRGMRARVESGAMKKYPTPPL